MPKVGLNEIKVDENKLATVSPPTASGGFDMKQIADIIAGIRAMFQEAKALQPQKPTTAPTPTDAITKDQLYDFARKFLDNLIAQGMGDMSVSQAIGSIPLTVKGIRGLIK